MLGICEGHRIDWSGIYENLWIKWYILTSKRLTFNTKNSDGVSLFFNEVKHW